MQVFHTPVQMKNKKKAFRSDTSFQLQCEAGVCEGSTRNSTPASSIWNQAAICASRSSWTLASGGGLQGGCGGPRRRAKTLFPDPVRQPRPSAQSPEEEAATREQPEGRRPNERISQRASAGNNPAWARFQNRKLPAVRLESRNREAA